MNTSIKNAFYFLFLMIFFAILLGLLKIYSPFFPWEQIKANLFNLDSGENIRNPLVGVMFLFVIFGILKIPYANIFLRRIFVNTFLLCKIFWRIIYVNNEAKIYSLVVMPIIFIEIASILTFNMPQANVFSFFIFVSLAMICIFLLFTIRSDMDGEYKFFITDKKISTFINYPFKKIN